MFKHIVEEIKNKNVKKVFVQLPEGLKTKSAELAGMLEKQGIDCIVSGDACYGACDIKDHASASCGCDLLVHVGHSKFYVDFPTTLPVLYYPWFIDANLDIDFSAIKEKRIGLLTSIQHVMLLDKIKEKLEHENKIVFIGGQILGCWTVNAEKIFEDIEAFVFVGSGTFHPLALKGKPVYVLDLEKKSIYLLSAGKHEKIRWGRIFNAKSARTFAVLVSSKKGQFNLLGQAEEIKKSIEAAGKKAFIVVMDEINDAKLAGIKADAFINTACPRIADDTFSRPFINAGDVEKIFE